MALHNKALMITMTLGMPPQSKKLKTHSDRITDDNGAEPNQAAVVAKLFARSDIRDLVKVTTAARTWFKEKTLPYGRGRGLIPAKSFFTFMQDISTFRKQFEKEKQHLINNMSEVLKNAQAVNGSLFDPNNYPSLAELEESIYFSIECNPVPAANDFDKLADLTPEEIDILKREAVITANSHLNAALKDLFQRMLGSLTRAVDRLNDDEHGCKIFRGTIVTNIHKALEAAETLNIEEDDQLTKLASAVKDVFGDITADQLRQDTALRKETADKAAKLVEQISDIL